MNNLDNLFDGNHDFQNRAMTFDALDDIYALDLSVQNRKHRDKVFSKESLDRLVNNEMSLIKRQARDEKRQSKTFDR